MTNLTKISLGNWTKQVVSIGGTGNLTLGAVLQHPTCAETVGVDTSFHYVIRAANNTPIEAGVGTMIDSITLRRDRVYNKMVDNVYSSVDYTGTASALTNTDIPEGAFVFTAPTEEMLYDLMREQSEVDYGDVSGTVAVRFNASCIRANLTGDTVFDVVSSSLPPTDVNHEIIVKVTSEDFTTGGQLQGYKLSFTGATINYQGRTSNAVSTLGQGKELQIRLVNIAGTQTYEMYVLNDVSTMDYGDVSGIEYISFQYECIVCNLTGDCTLSVLVDTLPSDLRNHRVLLKITSNNNPAVTDPFNMGYTVTLEGTDFTIDGVTPFPPLQIGGNGFEVLLQLTNIANTNSYRVENLSKFQFPQNIGILSGSVALDIRHAFTIGKMVGSDTTVTVGDVFPDVSVLEPAHFTFVNSSSVTKTLLWDTSLFSIAGSTLSQATLLPDCKIDFDVRRNPLNTSISYEVKVGDVNYNQPASGLATSWNPSDVSTSFLLSNSNKSSTMTANTTATGRAFGGKNVGKWRFAIALDSIYSGGSSFVMNIRIGITTLSLPLNSLVGNSATSYALQLVKSSAFSSAPITNSTAGTAYAAFTPVANDVFGLCVDFDEGKIWFTRNGLTLNSGDPESGSMPDYSIDTGPIYFPGMTFSKANSSAGSGLWTLLNEVEDPFSTTWPSYRNWTA